jgi:phospholipid-transporting ATPase
MYYGSNYSGYAQGPVKQGPPPESKELLTAGELERRYQDHHHMDKQAKAGLLKDYRDVRIGSSQHFFSDNTISTTKYTVYSFFFKNLFEQFTKMANVYFLFLACLQVIPDVTTSAGIPTYLPPLLVIVLLTMIKDGYEDYKRYKSDQEENNKEASVYRENGFTPTKWRDIRVGDIVKVQKDQFFPADMVIICSSLLKKGQCFIETKNLDGETNLKTKFMCDDLKGRFTNEQQVDFF